MPQHQPGRRRFGRRAASLLAPALVGSLILSSGPAAPAAPASTDLASAQPAGASRQTYPAGLYFVQLQDRPVAAYSRTAPARGERLNTRTEAVRDYIGQLKRKRDKVLDAVDGVRPLYSYQLLLNGFAAKLTARQANELARTPGVASLARNEMRRLADTATAETATAAGTTTEAKSGTAAAMTGPTTVRSGTPKAKSSTSTTKAASAAGGLPPADTAAFLGLKKSGGLYSKFPGGRRNAGTGTIIGVLDTGIDPGNPSLKALPEPRPDAAIIAKKWKGVCETGDAPTPVTCNNKLIGAQYFNKGLEDPGEGDWASPMDAEGHGTHTATTAAGNYDVPATVPDTGISGRISGIAPAARVAAYKICFDGWCRTVDIVAALEKAVSDGVDVVNYSLGSGNGEDTTSPEYTAMFNAAKAGVFISASSDNAGPGTTSNTVPWVTTVAASTHDLGYRTTITLGNGASYTGVGVNPSAVPSAPLVDGTNAAKSDADPADAARCLADSLDPAKVKGAIVICARGGNGRVDKSDAVKAAGGAGTVLYYTSASDDLVVDAHTIPTAYLAPADGQAVKAYAASAGSGATAGIGAAFAERQQAPKVAGFSSGGPDLTSGGDLLKPDITAPGVDITAGTAPGGSGGLFKGSQGVMSGTSMSAPHVAGLALLLRSLHPDWSPMEVKSALMTTATTEDDKGRPIGRSNVEGAATLLDYGAGHVVPNAADDPGLVYDSTSADWTSYMCAVGDHPVTDDGTDACATARKTDPSDYNSPTISVGDLAGKQTVTRTATDITGRTGVYTATLRTPPGYKAEISPKKLIVPAGGSATYQVTFTRTDALYGDWSFGRVTLSDGTHQVHSAVALRATRLSAPAEITGTGAEGSATVTARAEWDGTLTTSVNGLYPGTAKTGTLTGTAPDFDPSQSPLPAAVAKSEVTVSDGTDLARIAILPSDFRTDSDVDLWVLDKDGNLLSNPTGGNDEHVDLTEPGTYEVYVVQFSLPESVTSQTYALHTWLIGKDTEPDRPATITPAEQRVNAGDPVEATVSWRNLEAGQAYLGLVEFGDGTRTVGTAPLAVSP
ncbi:S8 family serine peptidase [Streptomyces flaveus]|uniref:S8 family serine peptidase n=1 Tax=Streptomyces flaveus TaxID=66370 RepID=UPI00331AEA0F